MKRLLYLIPVFIFIGLVGFFAAGLQKDPSYVPSVLIDKPVPDMALAPLPGRDERGLTDEDLLGRVSLVNIFGSWCVACVAEHPVLLKIREEGLAPIHGIDWRDDPVKGAAWLKRNGDPYDLVGADPVSKAAVDFGVTGAPETFVVDAQGRIRYKHTGPITPQVWEKTLKPMILDLQSQTKAAS